MTFLAVFFTIILIFVLFGGLISRLMGRLLVWLMTRQMRKRMRDAFGQDPFAAQQGFGREQQNRRNRENTNYSGRRNGKIFSKDVGEYVEFEEIQEYTRYTQTTEERPKFKPEPQISDAEWEDIK